MHGHAPEQAKNLAQEYGIGEEKIGKLVVEIIEDLKTNSSLRQMLFTVDPETFLRH